MPVPKLTDVNCRFGAPMGRQSRIAVDDPETFDKRIHLVQLRMVDGDYDEGGAYWGAGDRRIGWMYRAYYWDPKCESEQQIDYFLRATGREDAKSKLREELPNVKFFK